MFNPLYIPRRRCNFKRAKGYIGSFLYRYGNEYGDTTGYYMVDNGGRSNMKLTKEVDRLQFDCTSISSVNSLAFFRTNRQLELGKITIGFQVDEVSNAGVALVCFTSTNPSYLSTDYTTIEGLQWFPIKTVEKGKNVEVEMDVSKMGKGYLYFFTHCAGSSGYKLKAHINYIINHNSLNMLYNLGDKCIDITGDYDTTDVFNYGGTSEITWGTSSVTISSNSTNRSAIAQTNYKVPTMKAKRLVVEVEVNTPMYNTNTNDWSWLCLGLYSSKITSDTQASGVKLKQYEFKTVLGRTFIDIDVSDITEDSYLAFWTTSSVSATKTTKMTIYRIWLEWAEFQPTIKKWLYKSGDENPLLTGGWSTQLFADYGIKSDIIKNDTNIYFPSCTWNMLLTNNKINFTNVDSINLSYSKQYSGYSHNGTVHPSRCAIKLGSDNSSWSAFADDTSTASLIAKDETSGTVNYGILTINTAGLTGSYYVGVGGQSNNITMHEVFMEVKANKSFTNTYYNYLLIAGLCNLCGVNLSILGIDSTRKFMQDCMDSIGELLLSYTEMNKNEFNYYLNLEDTVISSFIGFVNKHGETQKFNSLAEYKNYYGSGRPTDIVVSKSEEDLDWKTNSNIYIPNGQPASNYKCNIIKRLYDNGDEIVSATGGWTAGNISTVTSGAVTKYSDKIYFNCITDGTVNKIMYLACNNMIDTSKYTCLKVKAQVTEIATSQYKPSLGFGLATEKFNIGKWNPLYEIDSIDSEPTVYELAISADNTGYIELSGYIASGYFYEVWLLM